MPDSEFVSYIKDILKPFSGISFKKMFGGYGVYKNGKIFALISDDELYFKADEKSSKIFKKAGSERFSYEAKGKRIYLNYWKVLPEILEDEDRLKVWVRLVYDAAINVGRK
jgi:DNA transformation protein